MRNAMTNACECVLLRLPGDDARGRTHTQAYEALKVTLFAQPLQFLVDFCSTRQLR